MSDFTITFKTRKIIVAPVSKLSRALNERVSQRSISWLPVRAQKVRFRLECARLGRHVGAKTGGAHRRPPRRGFCGLFGSQFCRFWPCGNRLVRAWCDLWAHIATFTGENTALYDASVDPIVQLDEGTFNANVFCGSSSHARDNCTAYLVKFYAGQCLEKTSSYKDSCIAWFTHYIRNSS